MPRDSPAIRQPPPPNGRTHSTHVSREFGCVKRLDAVRGVGCRSRGETRRVGQFRRWVAASSSFLPFWKGAMEPSLDKPFRPKETANLMPLAGRRVSANGWQTPFEGDRRVGSKPLRDRSIARTCFLQGTSPYCDGQQNDPIPVALEVAMAEHFSFQSPPFLLTKPTRPQVLSPCACLVYTSSLQSGHSCAGLRRRIKSRLQPLAPEQE
jgi:hypothetical protein